MLFDSNSNDEQVKTAGTNNISFIAKNMSEMRGRGLCSGLNSKGLMRTGHWLARILCPSVV